MNQQDQIKQLEESNQELKRKIELQAKQIEALKSSAQSDEERFGPYKGPGYQIVRDGVDPCSSNIVRPDYYAYPTQAQAEWEHKATQVRRKLQRICAALGPAKPGESAYCAVVGRNINGYPRHYDAVKFTSSKDAETAERILGYDLKYLDWNNSPEAQDAIAGDFK